MVERDDDERMTDFFIGNEPGNFGHGHEPRGEVFALVEIDGVLEPAILDEHGEASVVKDGGIGVDAASMRAFSPS